MIMLCLLLIYLLERTINIKIVNNETWILLKLFKGCKPIACKWIFKENFRPNGSMDKVKVRLIVKSFIQREEFDFLIHILL